MTPEQRKTTVESLRDHMRKWPDEWEPTEPVPYQGRELADALDALLASTGPQPEHQAGDCYAPPCEICEGYYPFPPHIEADR